MTDNNSFVDELINKLVARKTNKFNGDGKEYKTSYSTAQTYINYLKKLAGNEEFNNLDFLEDYEDVINKIKSRYKSIYTKKTVLAAILAVLRLYENKYKDAISIYSELLQLFMKDFNDSVNTNEKSEKQNANWISREEIISKRSELMEKYNKFKNKKGITKTEYSYLIKLLLLLLYTDIPARRRMDYVDMYFSGDDTDVENEDKNFFYPGMFVFNKYKTKQTNGQQVLVLDEEENADLIDVINTYVKFHPGLKDDEKDLEDIQFLSTYDGKKFHAEYVNQEFSRMFKKKIGPSMLRSIYVSNDLGDEIEKIKQVAEEMGTSVNKVINVYNKTDN